MELCCSLTDAIQWRSEMIPDSAERFSNGKIKEDKSALTTSITAPSPSSRPTQNKQPNPTISHFPIPRHTTSRPPRSIVSNFNVQNFREAKTEIEQEKDPRSPHQDHRTKTTGVRPSGILDPKWQRGPGLAFARRERPGK